MKVGRILEINNRHDKAKELANSDRVVELYFEGEKVEKAIEIVKGYSQTDQSIENNQDIVLNSIIAPGENIDKEGQVYSRVSGETLRDLI